MTPEEGAATAGQNQTDLILRSAPTLPCRGRDQATVINSIINQRFNENASALGLLTKILDQFDQGHEQRDDDKTYRAAHEDDQHRLK